MIALAAPLALLLLGLSPDGPTERARRAWEDLEPAQKREVAEWFRLESRRAPTHQSRLLAWLLDRQQRDPGLWPGAEPPKWFDPEEHAPRQPIPRRPLAPEDDALRRLRSEVDERLPPGELRRAYVYDYGARVVRRIADPEDPELVFANALAGFAPGVDLGEALVELRLDDGRLAERFEAFGHSYTDRTGRVYVGVTLYDAWASGIRMEMPDVDTLGIVHTLLGDRRTWKAPVSSASAQRKLYAKIEELFVEAHAYRSLRRALARCYLVGDPVQWPGWEEYDDRLHALWQEHGEDPDELAAALREVDDRDAFLEAWTERTAREASLLGRGSARRRVLASSREAVRGTLFRILEEYGVLGGR